MASPQTEDGYTEIANELLEAIIKTPMSDYEHRVFWLIVRKTYGYKKKSDWISQKQIVEYTGILKQHVSRTINKLYKKNMIIKEGKNLAVQKDYEQWKLPKRVTKKSNQNRLQKLPKQVTEVTQTGYESNLNRGTQNKILQNKIIQNKYIYSRDDDLIDSSNKDKGNTINEIIDYLNEKADTNYRHTTSKTRNLIKARFNEGFTLADFKIVIDKKISSWKGTEWEKFIRPETLFGTKFESYLNERITNARSTKHFENEREYTDEEQRRISAKFFGEDL